MLIIPLIVYSLLSKPLSEFANRIEEIIPRSKGRRRKNIDDRFKRGNLLAINNISEISSRIEIRCSPPIVNESAKRKLVSVTHPSQKSIGKFGHAINLISFVNANNKISNSTTISSAVQLHGMNDSLNLTHARNRINLIANSSDCLPFLYDAMNDVWRNSNQIRVRHFIVKIMYDKCARPNSRSSNGSTLLE